MYCSVEISGFKLYTIGNSSRFRYHKHTCSLGEFYDRSRDEARNILAIHKSVPVDEEAKKKIWDIINGAEEELGLPMSEAPEAI